MSPLSRAEDLLRRYGGREGIGQSLPKGGDSLRVLDAHTLAWLNLTGSGNESAAQVLQQPRMTVMFCAFEGRRLFCGPMARHGCCTALIRSGRRCWRCSPSVAARQIFLLDIERVQTSCGMSVPLYEYQGTGRILPTGRPVRAGRGLRPTGARRTS